MATTPHLDADYELELRRLRQRLQVMADQTQEAVRDAVRVQCWSIRTPTG